MDIYKLSSEELVKIGKDFSKTPIGKSVRLMAGAPFVLSFIALFFLLIVIFTESLGSGEKVLFPNSELVAMAMIIVWAILMAIGCVAELIHIRIFKDYIKSLDKKK